MKSRLRWVKKVHNFQASWRKIWEHTKNEGESVQRRKSGSVWFNRKNCKHWTGHPRTRSLHPACIQFTFKNIEHVENLLGKWYMRSTGGRMYSRLSSDRRRTCDSGSNFVNTASKKTNEIPLPIMRIWYRNVPLLVSHSEKNLSSALVIARWDSSIGMQYLHQRKLPPIKVVLRWLPAI